MSAVLTALKPGPRRRWLGGRGCKASTTEKIKGCTDPLCYQSPVDIGTGNVPGRRLARVGERTKVVADPVDEVCVLRVCVVLVGLA